MDDRRCRLDHAAIAARPRPHAPVELLPVHEVLGCEPADPEGGRDRNEKARAIEPLDVVGQIRAEWDSQVGAPAPRPVEYAARGVDRTIRVVNDRTDRCHIGIGCLDETSKHVSICNDDVVVEEQDVRRTTLRRPTDCRVVPGGNPAVLQERQRLDRGPGFRREACSFPSARGAIDNQGRDRPVRKIAQALETRPRRVVSSPCEHPDRDLGLHNPSN